MMKPEITWATTSGFKNVSASSVGSNCWCFYKSVCLISRVMLNFIFDPYFKNAIY